MERIVLKDHKIGLQLTKSLLTKLNEFKPYLPLIRHLKNPAMRDRHWDKINELTKLGISKNLAVSLE